MHKMLFLLLGSNYDSDLETQFGFIQNYIETGSLVEVLSIDSKSFSLPSPHIDGPLIVRRIQHNIDIKKSETQKFIKHNIEDISSYEYIVICDGIHFLESKIGAHIKKELLALTSEAVPIDLFYYISPYYDEPTFNGTPLKKNSHFVDFSRFIETYHDELIKLFDNQARGERILNQIKKQININPEFGYNIASKGAELLQRQFPDNALVYKQYLNKYILENITNDVISPKKSNKPASKM